MRGTSFDTDEINSLNARRNELFDIPGDGSIRIGVTGEIVANGYSPQAVDGSAGKGGTITISAIRDITNLGLITANGGNGLSGDTGATNGGNGGLLALNALGNISNPGRLEALGGNGGHGTLDLNLVNANNQLFDDPFFIDSTDLWANRTSVLGTVADASESDGGNGGDRRRDCDFLRRHDVQHRTRFWLTAAQAATAAMPMR